MRTRWPPLASCKSVPISKENGAFSKVVGDLTVLQSTRVKEIRRDNDKRVGPSSVPSLNSCQHPKGGKDPLELETRKVNKVRA